ncbi:acid protease [Lentinus tigrinus ALCF2SS1-7]|uniref:acid protease n=1 Tax=Lentinus tigrinus ALCF2SS1-7 TaxID=1328758 RepID=UPI0011662F55|nr:acid protease [Lentinus tigrinus ALCF2SS1-7]
MVVKYIQAYRIINDFNVTTDPDPGADYPQFDLNSVDTQDLSPLQAQDAAPVHTFVPPVGHGAAMVPYTDYISGPMDVLYYGPLALGTPEQSLNFQVDTGSADLWVASNCQNCVNNGFKGRRSSTFKSSTARCALAYGAGNAWGTVSHDTVSIGSLTVQKQAFCAVYKVSSDFNDQPISGLLGLAFRTIATIQQPTFFENLLAQKKLAKSMFSMHMARGQPDGSEVCFGCYDATKATGPVSWHSLISRTYWSLSMDGISAAESRNVPTNLTAAIDSGASLIHMPRRVVDAFYALTRTGSAQTQAGFYAYPCNATLKLELSFEGRRYSIHPADFNLGKMDTDTTMCIGTVVEINSDLGDNLAIIGDTFLKSWYSVFDYSGRVGLAPSINNS